jgi:hypothetical protein
MLEVTLEPLIYITQYILFLMDLLTDSTTKMRNHTKYSISKMVKKVLTTAVAMQKEGKEGGISESVEKME